VCDFLDIELDETILDPSNFVDGAGEQWLQNTSYDKSKASFDTSSVDKWRDVLDERVVEYIEQICYPEMPLFDYEYETSEFGLSDDLIFDPPTVPKNELADWITEYYGDWSRFDYVDAVAQEEVRQRLLTTEEETFESVDNSILKGYFLNPEYASTARNQVK